MPATRSIRLKVRSESYRWLNAAAREVNTVWSWCNATSIVGDWWLCLPVQVEVQESAVQGDAVGIDLGLKDVAVTSDGERLEAGRWTERYAYKLAQAQRRAHRRTARRIHRQIARCRGDALHKFSRSMVERYQRIVVGDVSSPKLVRTRMAKAVLDAGWGRLRTQLLYKGQQAGRSVEVVSERFTTRACSQCGAHSGPQGLRQLVVREWTCAECGTAHDRDVNAAKNILASRCGRPCAGTGRRGQGVRRAGHPRPRATGTSKLTAAA